RGAGRPEVVVFSHPRDPVCRNPHLLVPDVEGLVVLEVDGEGEPVRRDLEHAGQELPGPVDRLALEVIAEAEVAQHFEEGHVPRRLAHVLDVAGADAFLAGCGALEPGFAQSHELALELVHAGRREKHRRVIGNEHVAGSADTALGGKVLEIGFAKVVGFHGNCGIEGRINWVAAEDRLITWLCDRARPARAGRGRARSEWAWTAPVIVQVEEPGGNPGSVRTQGGFLSPVLDGRPVEKSRENRNSGAINARVATGSVLSDLPKPSTLC